MAIKESDLQFLQRCIALAETALEAGDEPFGSVLVSEEGNILLEARNQVDSGDPTQHPELEIARWAAKYMTPLERKRATVYTSGEHCPMCAAAHGWVGLGRIVYASSAQQLSSWFTALGAPPPPVKMLPIQEIVPDLDVEGPVTELAEQIRAMHVRRFQYGCVIPDR